MLFLLFHLDRHRYALDVREVIEVLPRVDIMPIPQAPASVAGIFNYRGSLVPAIDLSQLMLGSAARERLHTRIILVQTADERSTVQWVGLLAEKVTETLQREPDDFTASGVTAPFLGGVTTDDAGLIQQVHVSQLLPPSVRSLLFQHAATG
jgi:chemotaxis-related protein WspB